MKIYNLEQLQSNFKLNYLFLDNNALILLVSNIERFIDFIFDLKKAGTVLMTIPSIAFEFTRTESIEIYNQRVEFLNKYISIYPIEKHLDVYQEVIPVIHRIKKNISYPDFLLYCCMYRFKAAFLLSENHKDFTTDILDRVDILTIDQEKELIRNTALYKMNFEKFNKAAADVLSS